MDVVYFIARKDGNLVCIGQKLEIIRAEEADSWRALDTQRNEIKKSVLETIEPYYSMQSRPSDTAWFAALSGQSE